MLVAIHQPNFFPFIGFFHKLYRADAFVFLNDVQISKQSYTQRVKIPSGWLTVPIGKGQSHRSIEDVKIQGNQFWKIKILDKLENDYKQSPYFNQVHEMVSKVIVDSEDSVQRLNLSSIIAVASFLGIDTSHYMSSHLNYDPSHNPTQRIVNILKALNSSTYLTGPGGIGYMDTTILTYHGVVTKCLDLCPYSYSILHYLYTEGRDAVLEKIKSL